MVSQSVLLRGVNDDADTLEALDARFRGDAGEALLPPPRRPRARHRASAHFDRGGAGADARIAASASPGSRMPAYMLDIPGAHGKAPIGPAYISAAQAGGYRGHRAGRRNGRVCRAGQIGRRRFEPRRRSHGKGCCEGGRAPAMARPLGPPSPGKSGEGRLDPLNGFDKASCSAGEGEPKNSGGSLRPPSAP